MAQAAETNSTPDQRPSATVHQLPASVWHGRKGKATRKVTTERIEQDAVVFATLCEMARRSRARRLRRGKPNSKMDALERARDPDILDYRRHILAMLAGDEA